MMKLFPLSLMIFLEKYAETEMNQVQLLIKTLFFRNVK